MTPLVKKYAETVTITRATSEVTYVNGKPELGEGEEIDLLATVMPLDPKANRVLPEGYEDSAAIVLYTEDELRTGSEADQTAPDVVTWDDRTWRVLMTERRPQLPALAHWKSIAVEVDV